LQIFLKKHSAMSNYSRKGVVYHILDLEHATQHHMRDAETANSMFSPQQETNESDYLLIRLADVSSLTIF
jgi:hypothetical protein